MGAFYAVSGRFILHSYLCPLGAVLNPNANQRVVRDLLIPLVASQGVLFTLRKEVLTYKLETTRPLTVPVRGSEYRMVSEPENRKPDERSVK